MPVLGEVGHFFAKLRRTYFSGLLEGSLLRGFHTISYNLTLWSLCK
uniref:Uncharacterized protein n=1 Tax=Anguilla anguilla TaxID=7936 RepID=A0A0E9UUU6_ANGAN